MKLTKQKLEQLILQEMRYFRPPEFDPRSEKNYPEYADKLSDMYKSDPRQAASLADSLDEPIDVEAPEASEPSQDKLPHGTQQFKQESPVTFYGMPAGRVEIYYSNHSKEWTVNFYTRKHGGGSSSKPEFTKVFTNPEEAIRYYNNVSDNKYVEK